MLSQNKMGNHLLRGKINQKVKTLVQGLGKSGRGRTLCLTILSPYFTFTG